MSYEKLIRDMQQKPEMAEDLHYCEPEKAHRLGYIEAKRQAMSITAEANECIADLTATVKLATDALTMIAKYAPTRPASELVLAPEADASWASQAETMAKQALEAMAKVGAE